MADSIVSNDMDIIGLRAAYDNACKKLLAHKIFLAWIMKECLDEYKDCNVNDIAEKYIEGTPEVSNVGVHPDTTAPTLDGRNTEDVSIHEHTVRYDIRFHATAPSDDGYTMLIINVEAQNSYDTGYPIVKRAVYYASRMISAEYGTVFQKSQYDKIRKVYSIWICLNVPQDRKYSIAKYQLYEQMLVGKYAEKKENYDLLSVVMINLDDSIHTGDTSVINLLQVLLKNGLKSAQRKEILQNDFHIAMPNNLEKEVDSMCNLSEGVYQNGIELGTQKGIAIGTQKGIAIGTQKGIAIGTQKGIAIGTLNANYLTAVNIMEKLHLTFHDTLVFMDVPEDQFHEYEEMYRKNHE